MELKDTVEMMNSSDYKERFIAEYCQLRIRHEKLKKMLNKLQAGKLNFKPTCPVDLLQRQCQLQRELLDLLEVRAEFENINIE